MESQPGIVKDLTILLDETHAKPEKVVDFVGLSMHDVVLSCKADGIPLKHKQAVEVIYHLDAVSGLVVPPEHEQKLDEMKKFRDKLLKAIDKACVKVGVVPKRVAGKSAELLDLWESEY